MRFVVRTTSGAVSSRVFILVLAGAALIGVIVFRFRPSSRSTVPPPASAGSREVERTNLVLTDGRLRPVGTTNIFTGILIEHYLQGHTTFKANDGRARPFPTACFMGRPRAGSPTAKSK
jgi:hypothetical protein